MSDDYTPMDRIEMLDAQDLSTECEMALTEFLTEHRRVIIDSTAAWAQVLAGTRYRITVTVDMEKYRTEESP